jgi:hypothetical protein
MMACDVHPVAQIEAVCLEALDSGVQLQSIASCAFGFRQQPLQQFLTATG